MPDSDMEEITPPHLRCSPSACPGVFRLSDGNLLIIGKKLSSELRAKLQHRIAPDEEAIMIAPAYLERP